MEFSFRKALIDASLTTDIPGPLGSRGSYDRLERTEKGAVSYFIGMTMAKLMAETNRMLSARRQRWAATEHDGRTYCR